MSNRVYTVRNWGKYEEIHCRAKPVILNYSCRILRSRVLTYRRKQRKNPITAELYRIQSQGSGLCRWRFQWPQFQWSDADEIQIVRWCESTWSDNCLRITRWTSFEMKDKFEMGRKQAGSAGSSPWVLTQDRMLARWCFACYRLMGYGQDTSMRRAMIAAKTM